MRRFKARIWRKAILMPTLGLFACDHGQRHGADGVMHGSRGAGPARSSAVAAPSRCGAASHLSAWRAGIALGGCGDRTASCDAGLAKSPG